MKYLFGIVILVALAAVGYFGFFNSNSENVDEQAMTNESMQEQMTEAPEGSFTGNMFDLAKRGGDFKCTIAHDSTVAFSSGVVYISGDKIRGDFESEVQGVAIESHLIALTDALYVWSPIAPMGVELPRASVDGEGNASMSDQYADYQQSYNYSCETWSVDPSLFEVPSSITFTKVQS